MRGGVRSMTFGQKVRFRRIKTRLTQEELGKLCKVSGMAISAYENDRAKPYPNTLDKLCKVLKCTESDLADDPEEAQNNESTRGG